MHATSLLQPVSQCPRGLRWWQNWQGSGGSATTNCAPGGSRRRGLTGPKMPMARVPTAAARCSGPESTPTMQVQLFSSRALSIRDNERRDRKAPSNAISFWPCRKWFPEPIWTRNTSVRARSSSVNSFQQLSGHSLTGAVGPRWMATTGRLPGTSPNHSWNSSSLRTAACMRGSESGGRVTPTEAAISWMKCSVEFGGANSSGYRRRRASIHRPSPVAMASP